MRIVDHLACESRAKFWDAEGSRVRTKLLGIESQSLRRREDAQGCRIIERYRLGIAMREIFEHFDDGWVIVPEDIEFDETAAD